MPLWLRKTTFNLIKEYYDKQNEENEKNIINDKSSPKIAKPDIPDYITKAAKK